MTGFFFFKELCVSEVCDNGPVGMLVFFLLNRPYLSKIIWKYF